MKDFKPINTQAEFDAAIKDRLRRERDAVAREYAEWISPEDARKAAEESKRQIEDLKKAVEKSAEIAAESKKYRDALEKTRIVMNAGLDPKFASRLQGETSAEWKADAAMLARDFAIPKPVAPLGSPESVTWGKPDTRKMFAEWMRESVFPEMAGMSDVD